MIVITAALQGHPERMRKVNHVAEMFIFIKVLFSQLFLVEQGQKLVLSDALAVQSQGPKPLDQRFQVLRLFWDFKNALGSQTVHLKRFVNQFVNNPAQNH